MRLLTSLIFIITMGTCSATPESSIKDRVQFSSEHMLNNINKFNKMIYLISEVSFQEDLEKPKTSNVIKSFQLDLISESNRYKSVIRYLVEDAKEGKKLVLQPANYYLNQKLSIQLRDLMLITRSYMISKRKNDTVSFQGPELSIGSDFRKIIQVISSYIYSKNLTLITDELGKCDNMSYKKSLTSCYVELGNNWINLIYVIRPEN